MKRCPLVLSHPGLKHIQTYQPGKPIEELERELGIRNALKLASNENALGPSPKALQAIRSFLKKVHRYPDADSFYLKRALSRKFRVSQKSITLGNGSDELIVMAIRAFLPRGAEAVMATPTFLIYRLATLVQGGKPVEVPMKDFRYDLDAMARAITPRTRMVFIANPDNPVGTYVTRRELDRFVRKVPPRCLIFIDEAYYEFAVSQPDYPKTLGLLNKPNVIISRTFSKAYGLSGLRVGYAFGHPEAIDGLNKVREPFNINALAQVGALAALDDTRFLKRVVQITNAEKRKLFKILGLLKVKTIPSATNFILMYFGKRAGAIYNALLRQGIIVRTMGAWGLDEFLRVTIGTPRENKKFVKILKEIL